MCSRLFRATPQSENRPANSSIESQPEGDRHLKSPPTGTPKRYGTTATLSPIINQALRIGRETGASEGFVGAHIDRHDGAARRSELALDSSSHEPSRSTDRAGLPVWLSVVLCARSALVVDRDVGFSRVVACVRRRCSEWRSRFVERGLRGGVGVLTKCEAASASLGGSIWGRVGPSVWPSGGRGCAEPRRATRLRVPRRREVGRPLGGRGGRCGRLHQR